MTTTLRDEITAILPGDSSDLQLVSKLEVLFSSRLKEMDVRSLETLAPILSGTGGPNKVTAEKVLETARFYVHNKLAMYAENPELFNQAVLKKENRDV